MANDASSSSAAASTSSLQFSISNAQNLLDKAKTCEATGHLVDALEYYSSAVESFLTAIKSSSNLHYQKQLKGLVSQTLDHAEKLKKCMRLVDDKRSVDVSAISISSPKAALAVPNSRENVHNFTLEAHPMVAFIPTATPPPFRETKKVNGISYEPWRPGMASIQTKAKNGMLFEDPGGFLRLSIKQLDEFCSWTRCSDLLISNGRDLSDSPTYLYDLSPSLDIVQNSVTNCSFIASICVCAAYEWRFKRRLISSCLFPQDTRSGVPLFNPNGKYVVRLVHNGAARGVIIDDFLPVSKDGKLMCTSTTRQGEFWASLIEKAYMKVMGGYDFPGSNSAIDLYALTGWIPEHIYVRSPEFNSQSTWQRFENGQKYGDCLVTIGTGHMPQEEADSLGLIPTHNYAVLETRKIGNLQLLKVKNPWNKKRWKGRFSHLDKGSWTKELLAELHYDQLEALEKDDGLFWIDYESLCSTFDSIYLNWNPALFTYKHMVHGSWIPDGSILRAHSKLSLAKNPQYTLKVDRADSPVWVLLTRHVTDTTQSNGIYIAVQVYDDANGQRVCESGRPMVTGIFVNSPHVLVRFNAKKDETYYTLVICRHQEEQLVSSLHYSLSIFSTSSFTLTQTPMRYPLSQELEGEWTEASAGGNTSKATFMHNPQYLITFSGHSGKVGKFYATLETTNEYLVHLHLVYNNDKKRITNVLSRDIIGESSGYRHGLAICQIEELQPGAYALIASTFDSGKKGHFHLTVESDVDFEIKPIPVEGAGRYRRVIEGLWTDGNAAGSHAFGAYEENPRFILKVSKPTLIMIRLQIREFRIPPAINISVFKGNQEVASSGPYTDVLQGVVIPECMLLSDEYILLASTYHPNVKGKFVIYVYTDNPVSIEPIFK